MFNRGRGRFLNGVLVTAAVLCGVPLHIEEARFAFAGQSPDATLMPDTVELVNGGFIRGVVTEYVPGSHVVVRTIEGALRRFSAKEITAVRRGGVPSADSANVSDTAASTETSLDRILNAIAGHRLQLKVTASQPAALQRRISLDGRAPDDSDTSAYHVVCDTPCAVVLPARDTQLYRVNAPSAQPTDWFALPPGDAAVHADLVHHAWTLLPRALLYTGLVFAGAGAAFYGLHEADVTSGWSSTTGTVFAFGSATSLVASAVVWLVRPKSRLKVVPVR